MNVSMDTADGLLRHVLVGGFISSSPLRNSANDSKFPQDGIHPTNFNHSTPCSFASINSTPGVFSLPTFSPLELNVSSPLSCPPTTQDSPTTWLPTVKQSPLSSSSLSSQRKKTMSPVLNLAQIDETKVLKTPLPKEIPACTMSSKIPETMITSASPLDEKDSTEMNQSFGCHSIKQFTSRSDFNVSLRLRSLSMSPALDTSSGLIVSPGDGTHKRYLKFRRSDITFGKMIGKGGFGCVHTGSIAGSPIAVKIVQKRRGSGIHREILQAERLAFKLNLRHENIVGIYGVNMCEELRGDALILMELVTFKSLQVLLDDTTTVIKMTERLGHALQVAKGLDYLHSHNVAHLDVKPANVLITKDRICKLSDFGNLTLTGPHVRREEPEFTQLLGTLPYRAPELMNGLFPSTKADIYSLGITLWQMLTRESPHQSTNPHVLIYQVVKWNIRPSIPDTGNDVAENEYMELYTLCWNRDVARRPDADEVMSSIQNIMQHLSS